MMLSSEEAMLCNGCSSTCTDDDTKKHVKGFREKGADVKVLLSVEG